MRMATLLCLGALALLPVASSAITMTPISATDTGYSPPVVVVASGSNVEWQALDQTHVTQDTTTGGEPCFINLNIPNEASEPVRFDLAGSVLTATSYGETYACTSALTTPAGAVLLYHCLIHPTMRGALVITGM